MSVAAFCRDRGLAASSLFAWKRRLGGKGAGFVEAKVVGSLLPGAGSGLPESCSAAAGGEIELELRSGGRWVLVLRRGFDAGLLREVLGALAGVKGGGGGAS
jgi:hypothetical protein